jgi:excisionase family DNA binding protein
VNAVSSAASTMNERARVPRVTLTKPEAAEALGVSLDHLERHILPELHVIRSGRRVLIRVGELQRWAQQSEALSLVGDSAWPGARAAV